MAGPQKMREEVCVQGREGVLALPMLGTCYRGLETGSRPIEFSAAQVPGDVRKSPPEGADGVD